MTPSAPDAERLRSSLALWEKREAGALVLFRGLQHTKPAGDPQRAAALKAYREANAMRKRREEQLSRLAVPGTGAVLHTSADGRLQIVRREGVRRFAYNDSRNNATVGVGHLLHLGRVTDRDRQRWGTPAHPISMAEVDAILVQDLATYEKPVRAAFDGSPLRATTHMFDACVSMCMNIGVGGFSGSTTAKQIKAGHKAAAAAAMMLWDQPHEVYGRRNTERLQFLHR